jgi:hypothetical protein
MANTFSPNGFQAVRRLDGAAWTGGMNTAFISKGNTHTFFIGDPVIQLSSGYIDDVAYSSIPTQGIFGIFVGCKTVPGATGTPYGYYAGVSQTADTVAYVITDPNVIYRAWVGSGTGAGGPGTIANISENVAYNMGTGNTSSGISGAYIDFATKGTTSTYPLTIVGLVTFPPGYNGTDTTTAGNIVEVIFNQQAYKLGTTGVASA